MNKLIASCEFPEPIESLSKCIEKLEQAMVLLWEIRGILRNDVQSISSYVHTANAAIQETVLEIEDINKILAKYGNIQKQSKIACGAVQAMTLELQARKSDLITELFTEKE